MIGRGDGVRDLPRTRPIAFTVAVIAEKRAATNDLVRRGAQLRAWVRIRPNTR